MTQIGRGFVWLPATLDRDVRATPVDIEYPSSLIRVFDVRDVATDVQVAWGFYPKSSSYQHYDGSLIVYSGLSSSVDIHADSATMVNGDYVVDDWSIFEVNGQVAILMTLPCIETCERLSSM